MTAPTQSLGHVDHQPLHGLALHAVDLLVQHAGGGDLELIALPAHGLDEDGQVHLAPAGHVEGVGGASVSVTRRDTSFSGLPEQPVPQVGGR